MAGQPITMLGRAIDGATGQHYRTRLWRYEDGSVCPVTATGRPVSDTFVRIMSDGSTLGGVAYSGPITLVRLVMVSEANKVLMFSLYNQATTPNPATDTALRAYYLTTGSEVLEVPGEGFLFTVGLAYVLEVAVRDGSHSPAGANCWITCDLATGQAPV